MQGNKNRFEENNPASLEKFDASLRQITHRANIHSLSILRMFWDRLTSPNSEVQPATNQRKAKLVSAILLFVMITSSIQIIVLGALPQSFVVRNFGGYSINQSNNRILVLIITVFPISSSTYLALDQGKIHSKNLLNTDLGSGIFGQAFSPVHPKLLEPILLDLNMPRIYSIAFRQI